MATRLVTWNINSIRARLPLLERLVEELKPDIVCLQETKVTDELFPHEAVQQMGFAHRHIAGMKSYNGVAILSRQPLEQCGVQNWCDREDCRHIFATLPGGIELHNVYIPAGGDVPDPDQNDKFAHKLNFLTAMTAWWRGRADPGAPRLMVGDFNIAPLESDVWSHRQLLKVVSHTPVEVEHLSALQDSGAWIDAVRNFVPDDERLYSWWSYRSRDWQKSDRGRRLDHVWVSEPLLPRLHSADIHKVARGWPTPSDHAPVVVDWED